MSLLESDILAAKEIAKQYYDAETFNHAKRVAGYVMSNPFIPEIYRIDCVCLALMHDLLEDTDYANEPKFETKFGTISSFNFHQALELLTKPIDMDYKTYIKRFKTRSFGEKRISLCVYECAWWVKLADIKDHLVQKDTLSDSLRDRYMWALSYLL